MDIMPVKGPYRRLLARVYFGLPKQAEQVHNATTFSMRPTFLNVGPQILPFMTLQHHASNVEMFTMCLSVKRECLMPWWDLSILEILIPTLHQFSRPTRNSLAEPHLLHSKSLQVK